MTATIFAPASVMIGRRFSRCQPAKAAASPRRLQMVAAIEAACRLDGSRCRPVGDVQREAAVRRRGLEQQHVVEAQHGGVGGVAIGQPDRAGIETGQRPLARLHVGKSAQPDETVGIVEVAELADDRPSPPTPGLRRDGCRKWRSACRACRARGRIAEARRPATGAPTVSCEAWSSSALPRAACAMA